MGLCTDTRAQCLALRATLPATWMTLFSSVSLLQVYQMGLSPGACCWFALVRNSTAWTLATALVSVIIAEQKALMAWLKLTRVCGTTAPPLTCSSECSLASVPPATASHDCDGLAFKEECTATCAESYEAKSSAAAVTTQICHFDGCNYTDTSLQFPSCVTTTLLQCSDSTAAQNEKFDALVARTRRLARLGVVGCAAGYELASGDSLGALTCVSENESVACLTGSLPACQVTRCSSTNHVPIGVSEDYENITYGASCQAACAVCFESANHTELSCLAIGQLESNSVPPYPVCEEKKCVDVATSDSSMLAPDCTDLTSGDQCKVMCAEAYTGQAPAP